MSDRQVIPPLMDGVIFHRSVTKTVGFVFLNCMLFIVSAFLIWAKLTDLVIDINSFPRRVTWWGFLVGIAGVLGAPFMVVTLLRSLWVRRRLMVGSDRLQMLELHDGEDVVVLEIPFANISMVKYEVTSTQRRVGIALHDIEDPETYGGRESFKGNNDLDGWHLCITGGYTAGPKAIATALESAFELWTMNHRS